MSHRNVIGTFSNWFGRIGDGDGCDGSMGDKIDKQKRSEMNSSRSEKLPVKLLFNQ